MYLDESDSNFPEVTPLDKDYSQYFTKSGLYIKNRGGELIHVKIPSTDLAFQVGEALQIASNGFLQATPHCVQGVHIPNSQVARNTFACFMQPNVDEILKEDYKFSDFTKDVLNRHYNHDK